MEKFEIDIKWGSCLFIVNTATSVFITLLISLIDIRSLQYLSNILIPIFIIQLVYFTIKAFRENRSYGLSKGFRKFFVFIRLFTFYFFLMSFLNRGGTTADINYASVLFPYRKKDLSEFLIDENPSDNGITLDEFIYTLKRKFNRSYIRI